jgi:hypothetical protein
MSLFNNREIATTIWLFVIFAFSLSIGEVRKSLPNFVKGLFKRKILIWLFIMIVYTAGIVITLYSVGIWNFSLLKDTIIWFCFTGVVMSFNLAISSGNENLFRKIITENIKIVIVIEFLVNTYTFSLVGELVFVPFMTLIVMIDAIAQRDKKCSSAAELMNGLQVIIGMAILIYAVSNAISDYKNFGSLDTMRSFVLPPLLTISFSPLIYLILLFVSYEDLFVNLNLGYEKGKKLKNYARKEIIKHCLFSLKKIKKASNMNIYNLMHVRNEKDVDDMIKVYKDTI